MGERISISFFDSIGEFAQRYWYEVPRMGEEVMLGAGTRYVADKDGKAAFRVKRVVWGVEGPNDRRSQCVNIELEALHPFRSEEPAP